MTSSLCSGRAVRARLLLHAIPAHAFKHARKLLPLLWDFQLQKRLQRIRVTVSRTSVFVFLFYAFLKCWTREFTPHVSNSRPAVQIWRDVAFSVALWTPDAKLHQSVPPIFGRNLCKINKSQNLFVLVQNCEFIAKSVRNLGLK